MAGSAHRFLAKLEESTALRYALAPVCIAIALLLQILVIGPVPEWSSSAPLIHPTGLFQVGIVAAAWFGGAGPGFLAALLATLVLPLLITMNYPLTAGFFDLPRFLAFGISGLAVGWGTTFRRRAEATLRRSELELRKARNGLELKVLEQTAELRRSEALLTEAQKLSRTGSFGWKVSMGEVLWSEEIFRIFRYDRTTKPTIELALQRVHPEDAALVKQTIERASQDGKDFEHGYRLLMPDGTVNHVHVVARAVRDEAGSIEFVGAVMDVTDRKQAEEALRKAQGELAHVTRVTTMGQLTASIAHEVNQPVAAVVANADAALRWLGAQPPDLEEARQALRHIVKDGNRAGEVIHRIRALVKKKAPRGTDRLDVNDTILEVLALTRSEVMWNDVALQTQLAEGLPPIQGDRIQLQQVILNLIMNAVEAMSGVGERKRELLISTGQDASNGVLVTVQDSGPGLIPDSFDRAFDAFYTTKPGGMGMGLPICRSIIEAHGGQVRAMANVPQGAIIQVTLPAHGRTAS